MGPNPFPSQVEDMLLLEAHSNFEQELEKAQDVKSALKIFKTMERYYKDPSNFDGMLLSPVLIQPE